MAKKLLGTLLITPLLLTACMVEDSEEIYSDDEATQFLNDNAVGAHSGQPLGETENAAVGCEGDLTAEVGAEIACENLTYTVEEVNDDGTVVVSGSTPE